MWINNTAIKKDETNGFFSVTDLQTAHNKLRGLYGGAERRVQDILSSNYFKKSLYDYMEKNGMLKNASYNDFLKLIDDVGTVKFLKERNLYITKGRGENKNVFCDKYIFKLFYIYFFSDYSLINCPDFIEDIKISLHKPNITRDASKENTFINIFLDKSVLVSNNIERQFRLGNYVYDLKIELLKVPFIIEYNENQHCRRQQLEIDKLKFKNAVDNGFAYLVVPFNKESQQIKYIKECLVEGYSVDMINEIEYLRFWSLLDSSDFDIKKHIADVKLQRLLRAINIKVFGEHKTAMRNLASAKELRKITDIEKFITNAIKQGWLKTEDSIAEAIQNYVTK